MTTNVELYEALKPHVGQKAAGMIADVVPTSREVATARDIERVLGEIHAAEARIAHKLLSYFIPMWVMMGSMSLAIVGLVATRV